MIKITKILDENSDITETLNVTDFPDGTKLLKFCPNNTTPIIITWLYDNDGELFQLIALTQHLKAKGIEVRLKMPYVPNARMDRVKSNDEVFTLKYFANVINWLGFKSVTICNPHSTVSEALFDRVVVDFDCVKEDVMNILFGLNDVNRFNADVLFFPDSGSHKKFGDMFSDLDIPYMYGEKNRDWKTGKINGLNIINPINCSGKTCLIVDDIISFGGSMYYSALELQKMGFENICCYATHVENSILDNEKGKLIKLDCVKKIYTTNSTFRSEHEKIEIVRIF